MTEPRTTSPPTVPDGGGTGPVGPWQTQPNVGTGYRPGDPPTWVPMPPPGSMSPPYVVMPSDVPAADGPDARRAHAVGATPGADAVANAIPRRRRGTHPLSLRGAGRCLLRHRPLECIGCFAGVSGAVRCARY